MRPATGKPHSTSRTRHHMQTKWKSRASGVLTQQPLAPSPQNIVPQHPSDSFTQTFKKLSDSHFDFHEQQKCLCADCSCGRHLCQFKVKQPSLKKRTIYQKCYKNKRTQPGLVLFAKQYNRFKGPNLDMHTTYSQGFTGNDGDKVQRPKPQDTLSQQGPAQLLTSYSSQFPGHKGQNQYIKPTDKHTRGHIPFRSKSTYNRTYTQPKSSFNDYTYVRDQLRTGKQWYGRMTTYSGVYDHPNPQYMAKPVRVVEKKEDNPDYSRQYETTYSGHFVEKKQAICPAKMRLSTQSNNCYSHSKDKFAQNSDFKAFSPSFQALATSDLNKY